MRIISDGFTINSLVVNGINADPSGCMKYSILVKKDSRMNDLPILIIKEYDVTRLRFHEHIYCFSVFMLLYGISIYHNAQYTKQGLYQSGTIRAKS